MRRKIYNYNQKEVNRNMRRRFRKQAKRAVCVTVASATVLTGIPFVTGTTSQAKGTIVKQQAGNTITNPTKNAVIYNLSDVANIQEKTVTDYVGEEQTFRVMEFNITQNGNYIFTGSNEINGAYVDVHIVVKEGVTANLTFDNAHIMNDDRYLSDIAASSMLDYASIFPVMEIDGTANIYVKTDSDITSAVTVSGTLMEVSGAVTMKEYGNDAKLKLSSRTDSDDEYITDWEQSNDVVYGKGRGEFCMAGGNLEIDGYVDYLKRFEMQDGVLTVNFDGYYPVSAEKIIISGGTLNCNSDDDFSQGLLSADEYFSLSGGTIQCNFTHDSEYHYIFRNSDILSRVTGGRVVTDSVVSSICDSKDAYGNEVFLGTLTGLPANQEISCINGQDVKNTITDEKGNLSTFLPKCNSIITMKDGSSYVYSYSTESDNFEKDVASSVTTHTLTLRSDRASSKTMVLPDGFCLKEYYDDGTVRYTYKNAGEAVTDWKLEADQTFSLEKKECTVTIDGVLQKMKYGETLPEGKLYIQYSSGKSYVKQVFLPGSAVSKDMELSTVSLEKEGNTYYILIKSMEDMERVYASKDYNCISDMNIRLETDLDFSGSETKYEPLFGWLYYGIFDGNGHTITNVSSSCLSLFVSELRGTIKNLIIKNCTQFWSSGGERSGILCRSNYGTIENCVIEGVTVETHKVETYDKETCKAPYDYRHYYSATIKQNGLFTAGNYGTIQSCYATGCTFNGEGEKYPFGKQLGEASAKNCYFETEAGENSGIKEDFRKTKSQFASGEVCYLLNRGVTDGSQSWYQNLGEGDDADEKPVLNGAKSHSTVYAAYEDGCTLSGYSNLASKPVHNLLYTADKNVLTGTCSTNEKHQIVVTLQAADADYDGKEHKATLTTKCSDTFGEADVPDYTIVYKRDGKVTTDFTSEGAIEASVTAGGKTAVVRYAIKKATSTQKPTSTPGITVKPTDDTKNSKETIAVGKTVKGSKGESYRVIKTKGVTPEVSYTSVSSKKVKTVSVPKTVTIKGVTYKVTAIAPKAFANCKKLKKVTIGANVKSIGKKAFYHCSKLKEVVIKSKKLKAAKVGKNAFTGIHKKAVVKVPKKQKKAYSKWLKKRGITGKRKIKS